eukprot:g29793.t1
MGRSMKDKASLTDDCQKLDNLLGEVRDKWDTVCGKSVERFSKKNSAEEFRNAVHALLEWLSEAEQSLRFRGVLPDDVESLQSLIDLHK